MNVNKSKIFVLEGGSCQRVGWAQIWEHEGCAGWAVTSCGATVGFLVFCSGVGGLGGAGCCLFVGLGLIFAWVWCCSPSCAGRWGGESVVSWGSFLLSVWDFVG